MARTGTKGQWECELNIGGVDFNASPTTVPELNWFQSVHQNLPSLAITVHDDSGALLPVVGDGTKINIMLGDGKTGSSSAVFNVQGSPQIDLGPSYYKIKMNAVLDHMNYMRGIANGLYEGPSGAGAIARVASQAGLSYDGDSTNDSQVWLPNNKTLAGFARHVANHGWASAASSMVLAVTDQSRLLYRDLDQVARSGSTNLFGAGGIPIISYTATSTGLMTNNSRALGVTSVGFDEEGGVKELFDIAVTQLSNFFGFSSTNKSAIGDLGGRIDTIVRPTGNTHENFDQARHQNRRQRAMYSFDLNILTDIVTNTELLTKVTALPLDVTQPGINRVLSGEYIVSAITKSLAGPKYVERLTLTSTGPN